MRPIRAAHPRSAKYVSNPPGLLLAHTYVTGLSGVSLKLLIAFEHC